MDVQVLVVHAVSYGVAGEIAGETNQLVRLKDKRAPRLSVFAQAEFLVILCQG